MSGAWVWVYLALLLMVNRLHCGRGFDELQEQPGKDSKEERDLAKDILSRNGVLGPRLPPQYRLTFRRNRSQRPAPLTPKRAPQGPRFALSLDVPTSILSALIDLAKNHEMRTKAAANAELMARVGKRK